MSVISLALSDEHKAGSVIKFNPPNTQELLFLILITEHISVVFLKKKNTENSFGMIFMRALWLMR